ncbi:MULTISPECIES: thioredoxin family protein [Actinosynnema]|uniref:Thiol reductase thioredoxin n=1 Tax=Actinosynnema pretiosum TaxID=42197 RepID=A0A290ZFA2_9PSEU|nr:thioredoxin family protein [Actinosynnema pretiosum]ATE57665.1 thiol reductase thioredoxin [Actinosynnema pretiosum]
MTGGLLGLLCALVVVAAVAVALRGRGRVRPGSRRALPDEVRALLDPDAEVTLVQVTTRFCAGCRRSREVLAGLVARTGGVRLAELDVTERPELAAALGVLATPTTVAYDRRGAELLRVTGVPDAEGLSGALTGLTRPSDG